MRLNKNAEASFLTSTVFDKLFETTGFERTPAKTGVRYFIENENQKEEKQPIVKQSHSDSNRLYIN